MISYEHILAEIDKQVQNAKITDDEGKMREVFAAIHSLSAVALQSNTPSTSSKTPMQPRVGAPITPHVLPLQQQSASSVQSLDQMDGTRLQEEDGANGDSLFDF